MKSKILIILIILILAAAVGVGVWVYQKQAGPQGLPQDQKESGESCQEYCEKQPHIMCVGEWQVQGQYPNCECKYSCDTAAVDQQTSPPEEIQITDTFGSPEGFPVMHQWPNGELTVFYKAKREGKSDLYAVSSQDQGQTWSTQKPVRITDSQGNAEHTSIATLGSKTLLAWDNGTEVRCLISEDQGKTWQDRKIMGEAWYPYIYNISGTLWLVYISQKEGLGGVIQYITSTDGSSWSTPQEIIRNPDLAGKTSIWGNTLLYQTLAGELWLIWDTGSWTERMPEGASQNSDLVWIRSQDRGATWTVPEEITPNTDALDDIEPRLCEDREGTPLLFYENRAEQDLTQDYKLYYRKFTQGKWSAAAKLPKPYNVPQDYILDWRPYCLKDQAGQLWLAWASDREGDATLKIRAEGLRDVPRNVYVAPLRLLE